MIIIIKCFWEVIVIICEKCFHRDVCAVMPNSVSIQDCKNYKDEDLIIELELKRDTKYYTIDEVLTCPADKTDDCPYENDDSVYCEDCEYQHSDFVVREHIYMRNWYLYNFQLDKHSYWLSRDDAEKEIQHRTSKL